VLKAKKMVIFKPKSRKISFGVEFYEETVARSFCCGPDDVHDCL
jgi:hypothetical protein